MKTIFRKVSVKERLPEHEDNLFTSEGMTPFDLKSKHFYSPHPRKWVYPEWWLEEIELPSDKQIEDKVMNGYLINEENIARVKAAKWMRDFVLAGEAVAPLTSNTNSH